MPLGGTPQMGALTRRRFPGLNYESLVRVNAENLPALYSSSMNKQAADTEKTYQEKNLATDQERLNIERQNLRNAQTNAEEQAAQANRANKTSSILGGVGLGINAYSAYKLGQLINKTAPKDGTTPEPGYLSKAGDWIAEKAEPITTPIKEALEPVTKPIGEAYDAVLEKVGLKSPETAPDKMGDAFSKPGGEPIVTPENQQLEIPNTEPIDMTTTANPEGLGLSTKTMSDPLGQGLKQGSPEQRAIDTEIRINELNKEAEYKDALGQNNDIPEAQLKEVIEGAQTTSEAADAGASLNAATGVTTPAQDTAQAMWEANELAVDELASESVGEGLGETTGLSVPGVGMVIAAMYASRMLSHSLFGSESSNEFAKQMSMPADTLDNIIVKPIINLFDKPENTPGQMVTGIKTFVTELAHDVTFGIIPRGSCIVFSFYYGVDSIQARTAKTYCKHFMVPSKLIGYYQVGFGLIYIAKRSIKFKNFLEKVWCKPAYQFMLDKLEDKPISLGFNIYQFCFFKLCQLAYLLIPNYFMPANAVECIKMAKENLKKLQDARRSKTCQV